MSYYQNQFMGYQPHQSNYIIPTDGVLFQKSNRIIDQRDYIGAVRQTSEATDDFQKKRSQPPQPLPQPQPQPQLQPQPQSQHQLQIQNKQPEIQIQSTPQETQLPTPQVVNQSITPGHANFQSQSIFQSAVPAPSALQSQININNQAPQFQIVPIAQSHIPERQKAAEKQVIQHEQPVIVHEYHQSSNQELVLKKDLNVLNKPQSQISSQQQIPSMQQLNQSYQQNTQIPQQPLTQQQQQPVMQSQSRLPANPVNDKSNIDFTNRGEDPNNHSQKFNLQINNRNNQTDNQKNRQQSQQIPQQSHQNNEQQVNKNFVKQNSQFPPTHQYYNSALLEELNPYIPNHDNDESDLHYYAKFFEACGHSLDSQINDEQSLLVLNTSVAQFDLEVMQQLKDEMGNKQSYTVREFLNIYIKAIKILESKKMKEENIIRAAKDKLNELINLQEQARINEQNAPLNRPSILYIYVDEAKGLERSSQYIVRINFDNNQMIQTNPSNYSSDPQFFQEFKLRVNNPNTVIAFTLEDKNNGRVIGYVTQKLKQFYHQKKIDEWYILEDQGGALGDINKQIALAIQWVHSERLLYENILRENDYFEPVIKDQEDKLQDSIEMIRVLKHPFERNLEQFKEEIQPIIEENRKRSKKGKKGAYSSSQHDDNEESNSLKDCWNSCLALCRRDDEHQTAAHSAVTPAAAAATNTATATAQPQTAMNNVHQDQKQNIESIISLKQQIIYAYTILAVCVCFFRPNFIDVSLALVLLSNFFPLNAQNCNRMSIVLIITIFIDILWMALFTKNWFSYAGESNFCMILFIMLEIGECILLQKIKSDMQEQPQVQIHNQQPQYNYQHV